MAASRISYISSALMFLLHRLPNNIAAEGAAATAEAAMAASLSARLALAALMSLAVAVSMVSSSDPDILSDFVTPPGVDTATLDGSFFTYQGLRNAINATQPKFGASKVSQIQFPALTGLGVSTALLEFPPQTENTPHTHPRATEVLYVLEGTLQVAFVDTTNKLFKQTLFANDVFVFPQGLLHFQYNPGTVRALAYSAFGSANPGTVSAPATLFGSGIDDVVLETAFKVSADIVHQLQLPFQENTPSPSAAPTPESLPPAASPWAHA